MDLALGSQEYYYYAMFEKFKIWNYYLNVNLPDINASVAIGVYNLRLYWNNLLDMGTIDKFIKIP